jgi:hypothetical protein
MNTRRAVPPDDPPTAHHLPDSARPAARDLTSRSHCEPGMLHIGRRRFQDVAKMGCVQRVGGSAAPVRPATYPPG